MQLFGEVWFKYKAKSGSELSQYSPFNNRSTQPTAYRLQPTVYIYIAIVYLYIVLVYLLIALVSLNSVIAIHEYIFINTV